jgi:hypothetical protein
LTHTLSSKQVRGEEEARLPRSIRQSRLLGGVCCSHGPGRRIAVWKGEQFSKRGFPEKALDFLRRLGERSIQRSIQKKRNLGAEKEANNAYASAETDQTKRGEPGKGNHGLWQKSREMEEGASMR